MNATLGLLVDDHALAWRALLENIPGVEVVGEASNGPGLA